MLTDYMKRHAVLMEELPVYIPNMAKRIIEITMPATIMNHMKKGLKL